MKRGIKMKKIVKHISLLAASFLLLTACSSKPASTTTTTTTTSPVKKTTENLKVKLAAQATSGQVFQFLAEDKGYLKEEGIDVELTYINNGTDAFSALSSGKVDVISTYGTGGP